MRRILRTPSLALAAAAGLLLAPAGVVPARADTHAPDHAEDVEVETDAEMRIRAEVEERLRRNEFIEQYDLRAEVKGGVVTLRGAVSAAHEKEKAGEIARGVDGVSGVDNEILVGKGVGDETDVGPLAPPTPAGRPLTGGNQ